jgi:hypothetical protein
MLRELLPSLAQPGGAAAGQRRLQRRTAPPYTMTGYGSTQSIVIQLLPRAAAHPPRLGELLKFAF